MWASSSATSSTTAACSWFSSRMRRGAAFQIADTCASLVRDDQRALELAGLGRVDAEIGRQLHRAAHALGHVDEGAVGEHGRVQRREEIVGVAARRCRDTARCSCGCFCTASENEQKMTPASCEPLLEGGGDRDAVEYRIHGHAREPRALVQRHAQLLVGLQQLRVHLGQALRPVALGLRRGVVGDRLIVDGRVAWHAPSAARVMVSQCRSAFRRHSSRKAGSPFLREMSRTTSSSSPGGTVSESMSVTKPCL